MAIDRTSLTVLAPAKLNLGLAVLGRRDDGYHGLDSLVLGVGLYDRLTCSEADATTLACRNKAIETGDNLVLKAFNAFRHETGEAGPNLHFELLKAIPVAAGLGGGSSDAAATLMLCNDLRRGSTDVRELARIGGLVGSDVPLFFHLPCCRIRGRGEHVERASLQWSGWAVIVFPEVPVSTASVYAQWQPGDRSSDYEQKLRSLGSAASAAALMRCSFNDLEAATFRVSPGLGSVYNEVQSLCELPFRIAGSGSAMFSLFDDKAGAMAVDDRIRASGIRSQTFVVPVPVSFGNIASEE